MCSLSMRSNDKSPEKPKLGQHLTAASLGSRILLFGGKIPKQQQIKQQQTLRGASRATKQIQEVGINFMWPVRDVMKVFSAGVRAG